jgi:4-carboxymuconolactone decarboxylase
MDRDEEFERGLALRAKMFGPGGTAEVESADDFTEKFQEVVTKHCFGDIWSRDGLTERERSMLTCAMLIALGKLPQLRGHLHGAIANGVTKDEIREILLHSMLYAGIPAALDGFRTASEVMQEAGL